MRMSKPLSGNHFGIFSQKVRALVFWEMLKSFDRIKLNFFGVLFEHLHNFDASEYSTCLETSDNFNIFLFSVPYFLVKYEW